MAGPGVDLYDALAAALGPRATRHAPLGPLTTYGVGGPAALLVEIEGPDDLGLVRAVLAGSGVPVCVVGRGSNLLVADAGFDGVAVHLGRGFNWARLPAPAPLEPPANEGSPGYVVRAGASTPLPVLARQAAEGGWAGLTWAVGVPGSVGGAVRMNAGGHGADMAGCLLRYTWVDLLGDAGGTDGVARLHYGYRSSSVGAAELVVEAELAVTPGDAAAEQAALSSESAAAINRAGPTPVRCSPIHRVTRPGS
jgi:UDP-N-acetylmuramate dehydrogenase